MAPKISEINDYAPSGSIQGSSTNLREVSDRPFRNGKPQDIPRSKIEAINLLRSGEGESESKESVEARNEGQETSHSNQR